MFGQLDFGQVAFGEAVTPPIAAPTTPLGSDLGHSTYRHAAEQIAAPALQSVSKFAGPSPTAALYAYAVGLGPTFLRNEDADAAATDERTIDVYTAKVPTMIVALGIVFQADVPAMGSDFVKFNVKRVSAAGAVSNALAADLASDVGFSARSKREFAWTGFLELLADYQLIVTVGKVGLGAKLPAFSVVGYGLPT